MTCDILALDTNEQVKKTNSLNGVGEKYGY